MTKTKIRMGSRLWYVESQKEMLKEIENSRKFLDPIVRKRLGLNT